MSKIHLLFDLQGDSKVPSSSNLFFNEKSLITAQHGGWSKKALLIGEDLCYLDVVVL